MIPSSDVSDSSEESVYSDRASHPLLPGIVPRTSAKNPVGGGVLRYLRVGGVSGRSSGEGENDSWIRTVMRLVSEPDLEDVLVFLIAKGATVTSLLMFNGSGVTSDGTSEGCFDVSNGVVSAWPLRVKTSRLGRGALVPVANGAVRDEANTVASSGLAKGGSRTSGTVRGIFVTSFLGSTTFLTSTTRVGTRSSSGPSISGLFLNLEIKSFTEILGGVIFRLHTLCLG